MVDVVARHFFDDSPREGHTCTFHVAFNMFIVCSTTKELQIALWAEEICDIFVCTNKVLSMKDYIPGSSQSANAALQMYRMNKSSVEMAVIKWPTDESCQFLGMTRGLRSSAVEIMSVSCDENLKI